MDSPEKASIWSPLTKLLARPVTASAGTHAQGKAVDDVVDVGTVPLGQIDQLIDEAIKSGLWVDVDMKADPAACSLGFKFPEAMAGMPSTGVDEAEAVGWIGGMDAPTNGNEAVGIEIDFAAFNGCARLDGFGVVMGRPPFG